MRRSFQLTTALLLLAAVTTCSNSSSASSSSLAHPPTTSTATKVTRHYNNIPPPEISLHLKSSVGGGQALSWGTLVPNVKWSLSGSVADFDVEGGVNLQVDVDHASKMQYSLWTKLKRSVRDMISVSARLDTSSNSHLQNYGLHFNVNAHEKTGTNVDFTARAHVNATIIRIGVSNIQVTQTMDALGGTWTLIPRYNVDRNKADLKVGYGVRGEGAYSVGVHFAADKSVLTLSKQFGEKNRLTPAVATNGEVELEYARKLATTTTTTTTSRGAGIVTATLKPNAFVNVKYEEGPWIANLNAPMKGLSFHEGVKFNVRRTGL